MMPNFQFPISNFRLLAILAMLALAVTSLVGCASVAGVVASAGQAAGVITPEQAESINKSAQAVEKTSLSQDLSQNLSQALSRPEKQKGQ